MQLYSQTDTHGHETWLVKLEIGNDAAYLVYDTLEHADESYEEIDEHLVWSLK